jgi:hypothetical protein
MNEQAACVQPRLRGETIYHISMDIITGESSNHLISVKLDHYSGRFILSTSNAAEYATHKFFKFS